MWKLNRLRGTKAIWAKYIAILLGILFGSITWNPYIGLAVAVGYLAGETMGWGEWIGGLIRDTGVAYGGRDGLNNGIHWFITKFTKVDSRPYHALGLGVRGFYWWFLTFAPLMFVLPPLTVLLAVLALAFAFPLSVLSASAGEGKTQWNNAETNYGWMQDIVISALLLALIIQNFI